MKVLYDPYIVGYPNLAYYAYAYIYVYYKVCVWIFHNLLKKHKKNTIYVFKSICCPKLGF